jgi:integrase
LQITARSDDFVIVAASGRRLEPAGSRPRRSAMARLTRGPYQPEEAARLIGAARDPWERALLMFPLHTGTRRGEQRAIRWADVDYGRGRVFIQRSAPGALMLVKAPKSNRHRWVDLTPELAAALKAIRHRGELIFCNEDGSMLNPGQFHECCGPRRNALTFVASRGTSSVTRTHRSSSLEARRSLSSAVYSDTRR